MSKTSAPAEPGSTLIGRHVNRRELFLGFLKIGLIGFGGTAPAAHHVIVEDRTWLSEREYASLLGIGQILPGANTVNVAVMIGDRFQGLSGACVSVIGLLAMPLVILVILASLYQHFATAPGVGAAITGTAAAAAGLVVGTALKMAWRLRPTPLAIVFGLITIAVIGWLGLPLVEAVAIIAPLSIGAAMWEHRARERMR
jgi:chromate transporter